MAKPTIAALFLTLFALVQGSYDASKQDDGNYPVSGCKYISPRSDYDKIDVISCRNMGVDELPLYENVTKMELVKIPLAVLNATQIPKAVQSEKVGLRQLYWTRSQIKTVQSVPIVNLTELDLSSNTIQDIRRNAFEPLVSLYKLNLSHNSIDTLPDKLFATHSPLSILSISHNRLSLLPADVFQNLTNLQILDLSNNELKYLAEDTFSVNVKLQHLDLTNNQLRSLPEKIFHSLTALQHLSLEANLLVRLEAEIFSKLTSLMVLNLARNPLWNLPDTLLPANNTLFILTISHTKLVNVNPSVFRNLRSLRKLYLSQNHNLQNLPNDTFAESQNLKIIDLQNNNFTQLPHSIVNLVPDELLLDGNPWPCDCSVQWIVNWINSLGESKTNVRLSSYCNSTDKDLTETVYKMQCKPTIVLVSPVSYQNLQVKLHLVCKAYANPRPLISWVTPNGLAYINSEDAIDLLRYHPTFDSYPHLDNVQQNYDLHQNGDFHIKSMTRDDAGEYLCIATNKVGEAFARTRLFVDPTIMQRIKTGSLICGLLWVNGFLLFSVIYILIRRCVKR